MLSTRSTLATMTAIAATAAFAPAAAQAVPPTLGPPTAIDDPSGAAPPVSQPAPPQPKPSNSAPTTQTVVEPPVQKPAAPAHTPKTERKLLLTPAVRLSGSRFTLRLRCSVAGVATLRATGPGSITGVRMGRRSFTCRGGKATLRTRLRGVALARARRVSAFTVEVAVTAAGQTTRETALVNGPKPRRKTARSSAYEVWNDGHGSCQSSDSPYQSGKFTVYVPNFTMPAGTADYFAWQAYLLIYTDAGGYRWVSSGWYYWHPVGPNGFYDGPHSHSFWVGAGYDQYVQGAVEYYQYYGETGDWNYVQTLSNWGSPTYGSWCYFA